MADARALLDKASEPGSDDTILEYVASIVEDPEFEFGRDCEDAVETLEPLLVDAGCVPDRGAVEALCHDLRRLLRPEEAARAARKAGGGGDDGDASRSAHDPSAPTSPSRDRGRVGGYRTLEGGPRLLGGHQEEAEVAAVRRAAGIRAGSSVIQGLYVAGDESNFTVMRPKDVAKLRKLSDKQEKAQRTAFEAHKAAAAAALAGRRVMVIRSEGGGAVRDLHLANFTVSNGGNALVEDATLTLAYGRRYGLVGRNGSGKSTFLRALADGEIRGIPANCQVLHVEQEVAGDDTPALQTVLGADVERLELLAEEAAVLALLEQEAEAEVEGGAGEPAQPAASGPPAAAGQAAAPAAGGSSDLVARLQAVSERLRDIDADGAEAKAAGLLNGLSFTREMMARPTSSLSGGWRMRVALARALFVSPDLLLLDEPTNHLDLHAVLWLQDYLIGWGKTLVVVSHAREFLNAVCTDTVHLHNRSLTQYKGDYDVFRRTFLDRVKTSKAAYESNQQQRQHIEEFIAKFRYNANRAALVQSRIKALERMEEVEVIEEDPAYQFTFPTPTDPAFSPVLGFTDVEFHYPGGPVLFHDLNFGVGLESRFAVVGPNGIGKSTLLGLISGTLQPTKGHIYRNPKLRLGIFSQHHVDGLDLALTPLQHMTKRFPGSKEHEYRSHLASFGMDATLAAQPMYTLSGGQKSRVSFATVTWSKPHMLLLDEPSNHLDLDAVEALVTALAKFGGAVLMVSHDQHLIGSTVDELWAVEGGTVAPFPGGFEDYKKRLRQMAAAGAETKK